MQIFLILQILQIMCLFIIFFVKKAREWFSNNCVKLPVHVDTQKENNNMFYV